MAILNLMKLPFDLYLVHYLISQGYNYWLAKTDYKSQESNYPQMTLIPVQKPVCFNLPEGYIYFKIVSENPEIVPGRDRYDIFVNLTNEDFLNYKKLLLQEVSA
jgi:hypothetical protein